MTSKAVRLGFSFIELMMVIVFISVLAAVITPKFASMKTDAEAAAEQADVAAVQSGIRLARRVLPASGTAEYPERLDRALEQDASEANPLFTIVVDNGVTDPNWTKTGPGSYRFKPTNALYRYDCINGRFAKPDR